MAGLFGCHQYDDPQGTVGPGEWDDVVDRSRAGVIAPLFAGALLPLIHLSGLLAIDVVTFFFAIITLMVVHIPQPMQTEEGKQSRGNFLKEAAYGFKYIFDRPSLLGLQLIFFFGNLFAGISYTVIPPMILRRPTRTASYLARCSQPGRSGWCWRGW